MKISISTIGCTKWDFDRIVREYAALGVEGIEVRGILDDMEPDKMDIFFDANASRTKKFLRDNNLEFSMFGTSVNFHDSATFDTNIIAGKTAIDVCDKMGIPGIRVFGDKIADESKQADVLDAVCRGLKMLCGYASDTGKNVCVCLETHGDFNKIELFEAIICEMQSYPNFGILWDIGAAFPLYGRDFMPFYKVIRPYIRHTHIKDFIQNADGSHKQCFVGDGVVPVKEMIGALLKDGYEGYFSLEWEKRWNPSLEEPEVVFPLYVKFMRAMEG